MMSTTQRFKQQVVKNMMVQYSQRSFASSASSGIKMAPSAGGLLRLYGLDASQVTSTGPRGHLLKEDVLAHAKKHNLSKLDLKQAQPAAA